MPITTRRAGPDDAAELHDVAARTFALACPPGTTAVRHRRVHRGSICRVERFAELPRRRRTGSLLLAEADGVPVGLRDAGRGPIADADVRAVVDAETSIELSKFYVPPDRHGSGAARRADGGHAARPRRRPARRVVLARRQPAERAGGDGSTRRTDSTCVGTKRFLVGEQWHDDHVRLAGRLAVAAPGSANHVPGVQGPLDAVADQVGSIGGRSSSANQPTASDSSSLTRASPPIARQRKVMSTYSARSPFG